MNLDFPLTRFQVQIIAALGACLIVGLGLVYAHVFVEPHQQLTLAARERAAHVLDSLVAYEKRHGSDALVQFVKDKTAWHDPDAPFVSIRDPQGKSVLHTSSEVTPQAAWDASKLSIRYFAVGWGFSPRLVHVATAPLSKGQLLVGQSEVKAAQRRDVAITGFVILSTTGLLLVLLAALLFSSRSRARLDEMTSTLFAFAAGDVDRRVPMFGQNDSLSDLALAINSSLDYAQRLQRNLNHMSADIAHNLKKPLTRLRQRLELVSKCDEGSADLAHKIDESIEEIDSLVVIFEALLNIGQLQSGDRRSSFINVDMPALLTHIADVYEPIIADHGHHLQMSINTQRVRPVSGDRELLMEMIVNFVENAIQYCPSGTTIKIGLQQFLNGLAVFISDNGPGVPASEVQNLFERFYRLDVSREKPGHGLGIPFAVAIAELHGARVEIGDNHPGLSIAIHFPNVPNNRPQLSLKPRSGYVLVPRPLTNP
jgi:signal transduction histidine kinase